MILSLPIQGNSMTFHLVKSCCIYLGKIWGVFHGSTIKIVPTKCIILIAILKGITILLAFLSAHC